MTASRSVSLRANDSINLTTGVVTRSDDSQSQSRESALIINQRHVMDQAMIRSIRKGLVRNDLVHLQLAFERQAGSRPWM
jgi:hypothetical protein